MAGYIGGPWLAPWISLWGNLLLGRSVGVRSICRVEADRHFSFVDFSMSRVRMLIHFGVIPYLVFDGDYLPSKSVTEVERASKREESRKLGLELYRLGKISQSHNELQKAVDVTPEMARQLIEELKKQGVQYVVAPYEADAQLAYLERKGIITGILSEDSDLLVFGAKCLLTKLDQYGDCIEINRNDFTACREISLVGWSDSEFRLMAILSGCDYLASIDRMGLKTAYRLVRKYKDVEKILRMLAFDGKYQIPPGYLESFRKAELTFLHQRVFCPILNDVVTMTSLGTQPEPDDFAFVGGSVVREVARGVACGDLNPMTKQPIIIENRSRWLPKTPVSAIQSQSGAKFSDLKANKSIETFFKARRTPLAELDPNSFTPSPSQQRLLQTANTTWLPNLAPATPTPLQPGVLADISTTTSGARSSGINGGIIGRPQSIPQSSKRRRLCLEVEKDGDAPEQSIVEETRSSRFFSSFPEPSLSVKSTANRRRGKPADVNIWSDDSIEDVMAKIPDISEPNDRLKKGKLKIFRDEVPKTDTSSSFVIPSEDSSPGEDSQSSATLKSTQSNTSGKTSSTWSSTSSQTLARTLSDSMSAELAALSKKFSYQPESEGSLPLQCNLDSKRQNAYSLTKPIAKPKPDRKRSMTPLERLGAGALSRSQSCTKLVNHKLDLSSTTESIANSSSPARALSETSVTVHTICRTRGSEDQIIPDSEEESDSTSPISDPVSLPKAKLDLAQFTFVA